MHDKLINLTTHLRALFFHQVISVKSCHEKKIQQLLFCFKCFCDISWLLWEFVLGLNPLAHLRWTDPWLTASFRDASLNLKSLSTLRSLRFRDVMQRCALFTEINKTEQCFFWTKFQTQCKWNTLKHTAWWEKHLWQQVLIMACRSTLLFSSVWC